MDTLPDILNALTAPSTLAVVLIVVVVVLLSTVRALIVIVPPNRAAVITGGVRALTDGRQIGHRPVIGGRTLRMPIVETVSHMNLETIAIEISVSNAFSKGNIPLNVEAIANVKIASEPETVFNNAVERLLGKTENEIKQLAKDTLMGNLRGVLATLTPEEVNEDRLKFAGSLIDEADNDLKQLGLQLDTLKIQNVSDEAGYLDSIGRRKTAEVISAARKTEAEKTAEAEEAEANAKQRAEIAKAKSDKEIKSAQIEAERDAKTKDAIAQQKVEEENNRLRVKKAELEKIAVIREQEAQVAGEKARAQYEQAMEQERIVLQQKRLTADVIEPARAKKEAMELEAKGAAAKIIEDGNANLQVLAQMIKTYQSANGEGEKVFMLNMLPEIIAQLVETVSKVNIEKVSVIDSGSQNGTGNGVGRFVNQLPAAVLSLTEQIENATGVNILSQFQKQNDVVPQISKKAEAPRGQKIKKAEDSKPDE